MLFRGHGSKIQNLYRQLLDRPASDNEINLYSNLTLGQIQECITESAEYKNLIISKIGNSSCLIDMPRELPKNTRLDYYDSDTEKIFNNARNVFGTKWRWANTEIKYNLNSLGYRMKEFDKVDWSNYIAVLGCSYGVGVGLPLNETYAHKISDKLNLDLVNASIPGGNNDLILSNASRLLLNKTPPKLMIVSWSSLSRKTYWHRGKPLLYGYDVKKKSSDVWAASHNNYLQNHREWVYEFNEKKLYLDTLCKLAEVKIFHMTNFYGYEFSDSIAKIVYDNEEVHEKIYDIEYVNAHVARDLDIEHRCGHPGVSLQQKICEYWDNVKYEYGF
jgi:hypothetical protein